MEKTYQQYVDDFNSKTFMFSKSAGLACNLRYYVHNGDWQGIRGGSTFTVEYTGKVLTITDWEEVKYTDWTPEERAFWYLPESELMGLEEWAREQERRAFFDSDIAF